MIFSLAVAVFLGASQLAAPDSLVVPLWADTTNEIEAIIFPPPDAMLPLYYQVAWGDGETLSWTGPLRSSTDISRYHKYKAAGEYAVTVQAKDSLDRVSAWSKPYGVTVRAEPILKGIFNTSDPIVASPSVDANSNIYVGDESGTLYSVSSNGYQRWTFRANDAVYGAAAISRDLVYFTSLDSHLYCLDTTGKEHWRCYLGDELYSTPAVGGNGMLYVATDKGQVVAVSPAGKVVWRHKTGDEIAGSLTIGAGGFVYAAGDSVYCFEPGGRKRWAYGAPEGDFFYASVVGDDSGRAYVGNMDGFLYCIGPDGRQLWRAPAPEGDEIRSEVVMDAGRSLYFGTDGDFLCRMQPGGSPEKLYEAIDILIATPALSDKGTVYFLPDDGTLCALAANGRLLWTREVASGNKEVYYTSSPVIAPDGTVYVGSWDGGLYAFCGDGPPARTLWPQYRHDAARSGAMAAARARRRFLWFEF
jgi:outer membrane protein assembly factor BamB